MPPSARRLVPHRDSARSTLRPHARRPAHHHHPRHPLSETHYASTTSHSSSSSSSPHSHTAPTPAPNPRWLSDIKGRLGACSSFGITPGAENALYGRIAQTLAREWRGLVAGAEGFDIQPTAGELERMREDAAPTCSLKSCVEKVRWGDMDSMGHVNNASYLRYAESSRVHYFAQLARFAETPEQARTWRRLTTPEEVGIIYKRAEIDFLLPVKYPDRLVMCHKLADGLPLEEGRVVDLVPLHVVGLSSKLHRNALRVYEENVVFDYRAGRRTGMSGWMVEVLRKAKAEEQSRRALWVGRRAEVERWVEELEARTVNSGRMEDMGPG